MRAAALLACLSLAPSAGAAEPVLGFNYPVWSTDGYAGASAARAMRDLAATGAGWVALTPTLYVKDRGDAEVAATSATASDDSLRAAIRAARAAGLRVALKPHVDIAGGGVRALMNPKDPARWFALYRARLLAYARLAHEERCGLFVVGTELALLTLPQHTATWRALIRDVRSQFPGPLTYAANWEAAGYVGFWRDLDYVGIDGYYPVVGSSPALLRAGLETWALGAEAVAHLAGRPLLFTEVGIASQSGAELRPWDYGDFGAANDGVQTAYLQAFLDVFGRRSNFAGFLAWSWYDADAPAGDKSMNVRGKPALGVLESAFRAAKTAPGVPPPAPPHALAAARANAVMSGVEFFAR